MGYSPWDLKRVGHGLVTKQQQRNSSHWAKLKVEPHLSFRQDTDVTAPCFRAFAQAVSSACNIFPHSHRTHSKPYYKSLLPWPPFKEAFPDSVINSASYLPLVVSPYCPPDLSFSACHILTSSHSNSAFAYCLFLPTAIWAPERWGFYLLWLRSSI